LFGCGALRRSNPPGFGRELSRDSCARRRREPISRGRRPGNHGQSHRTRRSRLPRSPALPFPGRIPIIDPFPGELPRAALRRRAPRGCLDSVDAPSRGRTGCRAPLPRKDLRYLPCPAIAFTTTPPKPSAKRR
jgi:hypothetical protein